MSKTITAWVNGAVQSITVNEITTYIEESTLEDRIEVLENKGSATISTVTLLATAWKGAASPYYQTLTSSIFTVNSMVDLQPTPEQLTAWQDDGLAFTTSNDNGTVKVYVSGGLPTTDITVQIKVQEVTVV